MCGGFQCITTSSSTEWLQEWTKQQDWSRHREPDVNGKHIFTAEEFDKIGLPCTRIACPEGSLILFSGELPHGTVPNNSRRPRVIQFLRYIPKSAIANPAKRNKLIDLHTKAFANLPWYGYASAKSALFI